MARSPSSSAGKPIIIVGTGRCGSTMLHRLLALHDDLGWLSTFNEALPGQTWLAAASGLYRRGLPARVRDAKAFPKPYEAYRFWEHYLPGFSRRDRPQTPADVPPERIEPVRRATANVLRFQRRPRLLVKVTGWARMAYFDRIYPDAQFLSLRRDPRSVVSSWIKAGWLDVTSPPDSPGWQWGEVRPEYLDLWRELGADPVLSATLKIHLDLQDIAANAAVLPGRCHELMFEDLITAPRPTLRALCRFTELDWTPRFAAVVDDLELYDPRGKWKMHLSEKQAELVLEFLRRADAIAGSQPGALSPP